MNIETSKKQLKVLNQIIKDNASTLFDLLIKSDDFHVIPRNAIETEVEVEDEEE